MTPPFAATYVDTSVWCAYCFNEPGAQTVLDWLEQADFSQLGSAWWVQTEFASALGIQLRRKALRPTLAQAARRRFLEIIEMIQTLNVTQADFLQAAVWASQPSQNLRGGDALHLAVAQRHGYQQLATLDESMQVSARRLGFKLIELTL